MNRTIATLVVCQFLCMSFSAFGATIYVSADGQGSGSSWTDAFGNLQDAIALANPGDDIWVSTGEYYPTACVDCPVAQREIAFNIPQGVSIYGGFNGTESSLAQRNIAANKTTLNGNIGSPDSRLDNSFSVLTFEYPDDQNTIDGFWIINGSADGEGDSLGPKRSGGAIHVRGNGTGNVAKLLIQNCMFQNNRSSANGGAIHFYGGFSGACEFQIINSEFEGNHSEQKGGAVFGYSSFNGSLVGNVVDSKFSENRSYEGGAWYTLSSQGMANIDFTSTIFQYNQGQNKGGAITCFTSDGSSSSVFQNCLFKENDSDLGGALYLDGSSQGLANDQYENCRFLKNKAKSGGGAIFVNGSNGTSNSSYKNCDFVGNYSIQSGAALFNSGSSGGVCLPIFDKCRFIDNETTMYGGAMYNFGKTGQSSPIITNCLFSGNEADSGGSVYNYGGQSGFSSPKILNCTFTTNYARVGPCIYNQASDTTGTVQPFVSNCIFWENIATSGFGLVFQNGHAEPTIQYSLIPFDDCDLLNTQPNSTLTCGPGIIFNQNPNFNNSVTHDFRLQAGSPALDIGLFDATNPDDFDLDGKNRQVGIVDLGAFEFDPNASTNIVKEPTGGEYCQGDSTTLFIETYGEQPLDYQWYLNDLILINANSSTLTFDSLEINNQGSYYCEVLTSNGILNSITVELFINEPIFPELELLTDSQFCAGQGMKNVVALFSNAGYYPEYSWILNGAPQGETSTMFELNAANQDELTFELVSSEQCLAEQNMVSTTVIFEELAEVTAAAKIEFDKPFYCESDEVILTADLTNGGDNPSLSWFLNGELLSENLAQITLGSGLAQSGDQIQLFLMSDLSCVENEKAESPIYTLDFITSVLPAIEISYSADTICQDSIATFSTILSNEGDNPSIDWFVNGDFIESNSGLFWEHSFSEISTFEISAQLHSDAQCATSNLVNSNIAEIESVFCATSSIEVLDDFVTNVFPNPSDHLLVIEANFKNWRAGNIQIYNANGVLELELLKKDFGNNQLKISTRNLTNGYYFGRISTGKKLFFIQFLVFR